MTTTRVWSVLILFLASASFIISCKKDSTPEPTPTVVTCYLNKFSGGAIDHLFTREHNRMVRHEAFSRDSTLILKEEYTYASNGAVTRHDVYDDQAKITTITNYTTFTYENGLLNKETKFIRNPDGSYVESFAKMYKSDNTGKPESYKFYNYNSTTRTEEYRSYTLIDYDARGNQEKLTSYGTDSVMLRIDSYEYDEYKNPFLNFRLPKTNPMYVSPNNIITQYVQYAGGSVSTVFSNKFEYRADGQPSSDTKNRNEWVYFCN